MPFISNNNITQFSLQPEAHTESLMLDAMWLLAHSSTRHTHTSYERVNRNERLKIHIALSLTRDAPRRQAAGRVEFLKELLTIARQSRVNIVTLPEVQTFNFTHLSLAS
jgi:hypothetical protein